MHGAHQDLERRRSDHERGRERREERVAAAEEDRVTDRAQRGGHENRRDEEGELGHAEELERPDVEQPGAEAQLKMVGRRRAVDEHVHGSPELLAVVAQDEAGEEHDAKRARPRQDHGGQHDAPEERRPSHPAPPVAAPCTASRRALASRMLSPDTFAWRIGILATLLVTPSRASPSAMVASELAIMERPRDDSMVTDSLDVRESVREFLRFLNRVDREMPSDLDLHLILDNSSTHKSPPVQRWLRRHPRFHFHFTPTSSSWLNLVERWFRDLSQKQIRRGSFDSVDALLAAIEQYVATYNANPTRFTWTKDADMILAKIDRCKAALGTPH